MKCPLRIIAISNEESWGIPAVYECIKEECAWWGLYRVSKEEEIGCCGLLAIALALTDIMRKMPHENQFRK